MTMITPIYRIPDNTAAVIAAIQDGYRAGEWLTGWDVRSATGVTPARVSKLAKEGKIKTISIANLRLYHITWIAERWPDSAAAVAWQSGPAAYAGWVATHLRREAEAG